MKKTFSHNIPFYVFFNKFLNIITIVYTLWLTSYFYSWIIQKPFWNENYFILAFLVGLIFEILNFKNDKINFFSFFYTPLKYTFYYWTICILIILILAFFLKTSHLFSRGALGLWFILTPFNLVIVNYLLGLTLNSLGIKKKKKLKVVILGAGILGVNFSKVILNNPWLGLQLIGFYDDVKKKKIRGFPIIGNLSRALLDAKKSHWQRAFITLPPRCEKKVSKIISFFHSETSVLVDLVPDIFRYQLLNPEWSIINNTPIISLHSNPLKGNYLILKKLEDIILSLIILLVVSPIFIIISLLVKITSPGPILFIQERYGINGQLIKIYKFRSMLINPYRPKGKDIEKNDNQITVIGKFIRRTSLDELPQFINVIEGKMSIVGPRPHAKEFNERYQKIAPSYMKRHFIKPGITGWAQVNGFRGKTDTKEKILKRTQCDLYYINNWSIFLDIKIIIKTILNGFINKNAF